MSINQEQGADSPKYTESTSSTVSEIFNRHMMIFKNYAGANVPMQILKKMKQELQEYYHQLERSTEGYQPV